MKKMLLAVSILSTLAFGASNPGGEISSSLPATVGVPMEVRVEVLPTSGKLVLVDENNKLIDKLIFDHGKLMKGGAVTDSTVEKTVKLKKADGSTFGSAYKVTFKAKDSSGAVVKIANDLVLVGHGMTADEKLKSKLKYREGEITLVGTETEVETKVQSIIEATVLNGTSVKEGLYVGSGTFEAEVKQ